MNKKYLTVLSVISSLAVVFLHVNSRIWGYDKTMEWVGANVIECLFYFAVPVFFMISGATLINYRERYSTAVFAKKRVLKTLIPYIAWTVFYCAMRLLLGMESLENAGVLWFINGMLNNRFCDIFWFFTELFACYLCIPVLSLIPKESRLKCFKGIAAIGILTVSVLPTVCYLVGVQYNASLKLPLVGSGYLLYVIIGYILSEGQTWRLQRAVIYLLGACGLATHFLGTVMLSFKNGYIDFTFKGYMNFPCLLYSVAVFVFFKSVTERLPRVVYAVCSKCAGATFGVYILHYAFLEFYIRPTEAVNHDHILFRTVGTVLLFILCILLTKLIQRIPLIKHLIPS